VSEDPPAVVRSICGYVGLYVWWRCIVRVVVGERESEREGEGEGGGGRREKQHFVKTTRQAQHTSSKPLDKYSTPIDRH
jgi:hypothetical protein